MNDSLLKAILSMDSYNRGYDPGISISGSTIGNATIIKDSFVLGETTILGETYRNDQLSSFYAIAYELSSGEKVISYRGTDDPVGEHLYDGDVWNGWFVGGAFTGHAQAQMAFEFYRSLLPPSVDPRTANISLTGHSLGGGLAGLVGEVYNVDALAFDNMPFELAAEAVYWGSTEALSIAYALANPTAVLYPDTDLANIVYGSSSPWSLTDVPSSTIQAVALNGEVLTGLRHLQTTPVNTLTLGTGVDLGLSATDLHSMASLIIRMFADPAYGSEVTSNYWQNAAPYFWATLYDKGVGGFAERLVEGTPNLTGRDITNKDYAGVLRQALAYSAIDEGTTIFGNTGIRSFYNDADNLGRALGYTTSSVALTAYAGAVSRVFVQYAGELALRKINMSNWSDPALSGVLAYTNETNNHTLTVDLTQETWSRVGGGKFAPQDNIIGNYDVVEDVNFGYNKIYLDDYKNSMMTLWGSDSNTLFDRVIFSVIDSGATIINQTPTSGHANAFVGGDGADTVTGSNGNDLILGNQGNDVLDGGGGKDILAGGNGGDTYVNVTSDDEIVEEANDSGRDVIVANGATPENTIGKKDDTGIWVKADPNVAGYTGPAFFIPNAVEGVVSNGTDYDAAAFIDTPLDDAYKYYLAGETTWSPLVLDLNGNGLELVERTQNGSVYWDFNSDGYATKGGWITGGDGFLALDRNGNGLIDNNSELFGNTIFFADGFKNLADLDSNANGVMNASDARFGDLRVWVDGNADAISQSNELYTLSNLGISSINVNAKNVSINLGINKITAESTFVMNGETRNVSDVWFAYDQWDTQYVGEYVHNPQVDSLPDIRGFGKLPYLSVAMSKDPDLMALVQAYAQKGYGVFNFDSAESYIKVQQILYKWGGITRSEDEIAQAISTVSIYDKVALMEKLFWDVYTGELGDPVNVQSPQILEPRAFDYIVRYVQAQLLFQLESEPIFIQKPSYNSYYGVVEGSYTLNISYINSEITKFAANDSSRVLAAAKIINFLDNTVGLETLTSTAKADLAAVFNNTQSAFGLTYTDFENSYREYSVGAKTDQQTIFGKLYVGTSNDDVLPGVLDGKIIFGAEGNDKISASGDGNILYGGSGNDEYVLSGGANTIVYESGVDRVTNAQGLETIRISDPAITAANVVLSRSGLYDLHVYINGNLSLQLVDQFKSGNGVETIRFSNGTSLDLTVLGNVTGTANGETLTGFDHVLLQDDVISDTGGNDTINGGAGADTLSYADAAALVNVDLTFTTAQNTGGAGTDTISNIENVVGTKYADVLAGNAFDNWIEGGLGNDTLRGGAGVDTLSYVSVVSNTTAGVTVSLAVSTAQNTGVGSDTVSEFENLMGSAYNDTLTGDTGANVINGGSGNDTIQGGLGNDTLIGNFGTDTLTYAAATSGITVSLASTAAQNTGGAGTDTISGFENLTGSGYDDTLTGDAGANVISGGAGNDTIQGYLGDDTLKGETGTDTLTYAGATAGVIVSLSLTTKQNTIGAGADTISGFENLTGSGYDDTLTGDYNVNVINGGSGNDTIKGVSGNDTLNGGAGNDYIESGSGNDTLVGDTGVDTVSYAASSSKVTISLAITAAQYAGAAGTDTISGFENLTGSAYNDTLAGDTGNNTIDGGAGDDTITGDLGNDTLGGGSGTDTLTYAAATSAITASLLLTTAQATGGSGSDTILNIENLIGSAYNDVLTGDANNNLIEGGSGNDTLSGGAGNDTASYRSATAAVTVNLTTATAQNTGGAGTDTISGFENLIGSNYSDTLTGDAGNNIIEGGVGADILSGGAGNDTVSYAGSLAYVMVDLTRAAEQNTGGAGLDTLSGFENIIGSAYDDYLTGDANDNVFEGGAGRDVINGGAGVDTVTYASYVSGVSVDLGTGGSGTDDLYGIENLTGSSYDDILSGDAGNNVLKGDAGTDTVSYSLAAAGVTLSLAIGSAQNTGGAGTDTVSGFENVTGSSYNDVLTGDAGNNTIDGLGGNDTIYGGAGNDTIYGGGGADIVYGGDGNDIISGLGNGSIVDGGLGDDELYADSGANATVSYASATSAVRVILGGTGSSAQDTIGAGLDKLSGFLNVTGSGYNDVLTGDAKNNTIEGGLGNDIIDGFTGIDTASYKTAASAVSVSLAIATAQNTGGAGYDTLSNFENLTGSNYNDTLTGDFRSNILEGGLGNDILNGGDGSDTASYSAAGSSVSVSLAVTTAQNTGGAGTDTLSYIENLVGSLYNDTLTGDAGNNILEGGLGNDTLTGGAGSDTASYSAAASSVTVNLATTVAQNTNGAGTDILSGIESLIGSAFGDTLTGDAGNNVIEGGAGNDLLNGAAGSDTASYSAAASSVTVNLATTVAQNTNGAGTDTLSGFENLIGSIYNDYLTGDANANTIEGGAGNDVLSGAAGTDTVSYSTAGSPGVTVSLAITSAQNTVGAGSDTLTGFENLVGSSYNDVLSGSSGDNILDGGAGVDTVSYSAAASAVTVSLAVVVSQNTGGAGSDTLTGFENLTGSSYDDSLTGDMSANRIDGGSGNDTISSGDGDDTVIGGAGTDILSGGNGSDTVSYVNSTSAVTVSLAVATAQDTIGAGLDTLSGFENLMGSNYSDTLTGDSGNNVIDGGLGSSGNDILSGGAGIDTVSYYGTSIPSYGSYYSNNAVTVSLAITTSQNTIGAGYDTLSGFENLRGTLNGDTLTGDAGANIIEGMEGDDLIDGGAGNDTLSGGSGADTLAYATATAAIYISLAVTSAQATNGSGSDTISGFENILGSGYNDILTGDANANTINGGAGNDTIQGGLGNDTLTGDAGIDTLSYSTSTAGVTVYLATTLAQNTIGAGTDLISGFENLLGSAYSDMLTGDAGDNTIEGGLGNDTIVGGAGLDTLSYKSSSSAITVNLATASAQNTVGAGTDTITGMENILGSAYNDTLSGDANANTIEGGAGNDTMNGGAGIDTLSYTLATAAITASLALATAQNTGGAGTDTISAFENILGSGYNDILTGDTGTNTINGGAGNDTIDGGAGDDILTGDAGTDVLSYASASSSVTISLAVTTAQNTVAAGTDTISGFENLTGSGYNDILTGDANANTIEGGAGNDTITGAAGSDTVSYKSATAAVTVNLATTTAQNTVGAGSDTITGMENILGSSYNDTLTGDGNTNTIEGGLGNDTMNGGAGTDTLSYVSAASGVVVSLALATAQATGGAGTDTISGFENLTGSRYNDTLSGDANANTINGGVGNDTVDGGAGNDILTGDAGTDTLSYASAASAVTLSLALTTAQVTGGAGTDTVSGFEAILGSGYNDILTGDANANTIEGGLGNDTMNGGTGTDTLSYASATAGITVSLALTTAQVTGGAGTDTISGFEAILGSGYADILTGDANVNTLTGGAGNDTLVGGAGIDTLVGEAGADTYKFAAGSTGTSDVVTGFSLAEGDKINVKDVLTGFDPLTKLITDYVEFTTSGSNTIVKIDADGTGTGSTWVQIATLTGVTGLTDEQALLNSGNLVAS